MVKHGKIQNPVSRSDRSISKTKQSKWNNEKKHFSAKRVMSMLASWSVYPWKIDGCWSGIEDSIFPWIFLFSSSKRSPKRRETSISHLCLHYILCHIAALRNAYHPIWIYDLLLNHNIGSIDWLRRIFCGSIGSRLRLDALFLVQFCDYKIVI